MFRVTHKAGINRPTVHTSHRPSGVHKPSIKIDGTHFDVCVFDDQVDPEDIWVNMAHMMTLSLSKGQIVNVEFDGVTTVQKVVTVEDVTTDDVTTNEVDVVEEPLPESEYGTVTTLAELPIAYKDMNNKEEDVQCLIGPDLGDEGTDPHNGKYVALFMNKTMDERKMVQMDDLGHVNRFRDNLMLQGWRMIKPPKFNTEKKKTRTERRANERAQKKLQQREDKRKRAAKERKEKLTVEMAKLKQFAKALK